MSTPRLLLSMTVRNEADGWLPQVLRHALRYVDAVAITDDASTDDTAAVCRRICGSRLAVLHTNPAPLFLVDEARARCQQWELAESVGAEWILTLDSDEQLENRAVFDLTTELDDWRVDVIGFRLFDFWDAEHYRDEPPLWTAHRRHWPLLVRWRPDVDYASSWPTCRFHAPRIPPVALVLPRRHSTLRVKHFGCLGAETRARKHARYRRLDPHGEFGHRRQVDSLLDPSPRLVRWTESAIESEPQSSDRGAAA